MKKFIEKSKEQKNITIKKLSFIVAMKIFST